MMKLLKDKNKLILLLGCVLVFQIILILFFNIFSDQNRKARSFEKKLLKSFRKSDVVSIEVSDYQDFFLVEKKDKSWLIKVGDNYMPGNKAKIDSFLKTLSDIPKGIIRDKGIEEASEKHFGFDEKSYQKILVTMKNKKTHTLFLGNIGSRRGTSYIRYNEEKKIREINSFISSETSNQPVQWAETKIFDNIVIEDVESFEIDSKLNWFTGQYTIKYTNTDEKNKEVFSISPIDENKKPKSFALENMIKNLLDLNIDDYKFNDTNTNRPIAGSLKLGLKNEKFFLINIYNADKDDIGDYIIDVDFNNYLYLVDENDVKRFVKAKNELLEKKQVTE